MEESGSHRGGNYDPCGFRSLYFGVPGGAYKDGLGLVGLGWVRRGKVMETYVRFEYFRVMVEVFRE